MTQPVQRIEQHRRHGTGDRPDHRVLRGHNVPEADIRPFTEQLDEVGEVVDRADQEVPVGAGDPLHPADLSEIDAHLPLPNTWAFTRCTRPASSASSTTSTPASCNVSAPRQSANVGGSRIAKTTRRMPAVRISSVHERARDRRVLHGSSEV